ncbi:MAG: hypothetical protein Q7W02_00095 [Candidatus Rokubacteria bacterium]|nr:hypothetical protein [Candidatus Rokubacteria bacterium]
MNPAAEAVYVRGRHAGFPSIVVNGLVRAGASGWWVWIGSAGPADIESAHHQLDNFEAHLHEDAARIIERARADADRLQPSAFDDHLDELVTETLKDTPRASPGLSPGYYSSEQAARDREAEAVLAALAAKAP